MKKCITVILSLVLIFGFGSTSFGAEEKGRYDSLNPGKEVLDLYEADTYSNPYTHLLYIYSEYPSVPNPEKATLSDYLDASGGGLVFLNPAKGSNVRKLDAKGNLETFSFYVDDSFWTFYSLCSCLFSSEFKVQNVYLFYNGRVPQAPVALLKTNQGDFAFTGDPGLSGPEWYLMPLERFAKAMDYYCEEKDPAGDGWFGLSTSSVPWLADYVFDGEPLTLAKYQEQMAKVPPKSQMGIYRGVQWSHFASGMDFDSLRSTLTPVFLERKILDTDTYVYRDAAGTEVARWPETAGAKAFLEYALFGSSRYKYVTYDFSNLREDSQETMYCRMESPEVGICIGVRSKLGNLMLYQPSAEEEVRYLLPYEHFCELAKTVDGEGGGISPELLAPYLVDDTVLTAEEYQAMMNPPEESTDDATDPSTENSTDTPADGSGERTSSWMPMGILGGVLILLVAGTAIVLLPLGKKERC